MSDEQTNPLYPKKPVNASDFKKAVAWFGGRELIASLKGVIMYAIYGENIDPRSWMNAKEYPNVEEKIIQHEIEKEVIKKEIETEEVKLQSLREAETITLSEEENLHIVRKTEATEKIKDDTKIKKQVSREAKQEWAKKNSDYWNWKQIHYAKWEEFSREADFWSNLKPEDQQIKEIWFDYIADSGDGQMGVYNVACMCLSDLWITKSDDKQTDIKSKTENKGDETNDPEVKFEPPEKDDLKNHHLLPRGAFLFVGGDTAYHASNYQTLYDRFQLPFRWAFTSVRQFMAEKYTLKETIFPTTGETAKAENDKKLENKSKELEGSIPAFLHDKLYSDTEPPRPIFGIPANHDYYDGIDGFNRLFRRPPFDDIEENMTYTGSRGKMLLQIPTFSREQEASYIAIRLPFDWWMFGIDSENEKLDFRQELFFKQIIENKPTKLILATPEPTTVFGKKSGDEDKTAVYLKTITSELGLSQPFLTDGKLKPEQPLKKDLTKKTAQVSQTTGDETEEQPKADLSKKYCRLDLSGDVHHYARYWGEKTRDINTDKYSSDNYASVVAGGGGAFFDVTRTLIGKPEYESGNPLNGDRKVRGEIPPQQIFPSEIESVDKTADKIFDLWNLRNGGYVQIAGAVIGIIIFFLLNYYSNVSHLQWISNDVITKFFAAENNIYYSGAVIFLLVVAIFVFVSAKKLNTLIKTLKEKSLKRQLDKDIDGRIIQAAKTSLIPLGFSAALYILFLLFAYSINIVFIPDTGRFESYLLSLILFLHIVISILLLWLSSEYTNWLAVSFKIMRGFNQKTTMQKIEDPNDKTNNWFERQIGKVLRNYTYQYFPANVVSILAIVVLLVGINLFGRMQIAATLADLVLTLTVAGIFFLVYYFATGVGAAYHKPGLNKHYFKPLGIWHAILQVGSTYILFVYGSWKVVLLVFLLIIILNGSAILSYIIKNLFGGKNKESFGNKVANFRFAAVLTKWIDSRVLFFVWLILGLPFIFLYFLSDSKNGFYQTIQDFVIDTLSKHDIYIYLQKLFDNTFSTDAKDFNKYIIILISIFAVGYIGYVLSRVWLSWYLAVTMFFDGHNNEIGGAARIEGFKHILRIKVEEEKLTVYVIGFDEAEPEMKDLKLKLVDKFELNCRTIS